MIANGRSRAAVALAREVMRIPEAQLCRACTELIGVTGAGITLMAGAHSGPISVSRGPFATLEDAQYTTGEGPCQDAFPRSLGVDYRAEIHQASGMIAVQLQIHPDEALIRLRGYAFANSEPLAAIATQVIRGQLRLANDRAERDRRS